MGIAHPTSMFLCGVNMNSKPPELGVRGLLVSSIFNDSYLHSATPIHVIEGEGILDSSRASHSVVDTRLGVLPLGRLFAKDD